MVCDHVGINMPKQSRDYRPALHGQLLIKTQGQEANVHLVTHEPTVRARAAGLEDV